MSKVRAFLIHLVISAAFVGVVFAMVFFVWYPQPLFEVVGAEYLLRILFIVNFVLGPILTLIIFKSGKPGLKFDLTVIALVQIAALVYGTTITYTERPYYLLFSVDRFEVVAQKDVDTSQIKYDALKEKPWIGPVNVFAKLPEDPVALSKFTEEVIFEGKPDLNRRPEFWHPYADHAGAVAAKARNIEELLEQGEDVSAKVSELIEKYRSDHERLGYVPLLGRNSDYSMVVNKETGEQLEMLDFDPYLQNFDDASRASR